MLLGISFFALAAYVSFEPIRDLDLHRCPQASYIGIALATVALIVMPCSHELSVA